LVGRFCGIDKQKNSLTAPVFFSKKETLEGYMNFIGESCDFTRADYISAKLKVVDNELERKIKSFIGVIDMDEKVEHEHLNEEDYKDIPKELIISEKDFTKLKNSKEHNKKLSEIFLDIIKIKYNDIYKIIKNYQCDKCSIVIDDPSKTNYQRHIIDIRKCINDKRTSTVDITSLTINNHKIAWTAFIDDKDDKKDKTHKAYLIVYHGEKRKALLDQTKKKAILSDSKKEKHIINLNKDNKKVFI
jgi:hypothetical protein